MVKNRITPSGSWMKGVVVGLPMSLLLWALAITAYFALSACQTVKGYATCDNARIAVETAQRAVDRFCPMENN